MGTDYFELARKASQGDVPAVESLLEQYLPQLKVFIRLRSGVALQPKESVSDLVQSVCLEVLRHQEKFQWQGEEAFRSWLYTAARRKIADKFEYYGAGKRDRQREVPQDEGDGKALLEGAPTILTPSRHAMAAEDLERLEVAFHKIPEQYQEAILLMKIMGLSVQEAAKTLGRTEGATRTMLSRALSHLSEAMEQS